MSKSKVFDDTLNSKMVKEALNKERWWTRLVFLSAAGFLGLLAVFFAALCEWANEVFIHNFERSPYTAFVICPAGFVAIYFLQKGFFKGCEGSGIPQVIASLRTRSNALRDRLVSLRVLIGKIICTFLGLLSGASIGREGPSVHIGASLFNFLGRYASFTRYERKQGLIIAGASAGIAAAFNAPLAGIVFAIEELKGSFEERTSGLMLSAVILSGLVALALLGHYSFFGEIPGSVNSIRGMLGVAIVGAVGGALGGGFSRAVLYWSPKIWSLDVQRKWMIPLALGFGVAFLGYLSGGESFGTGFVQVRSILSVDEQISLLFPLFKLAATFLSYLSGMAGGVFAPSLSIGAGLGQLVAPLFPTIELQVLVVIGMVSYLSGVVRAPITAFVIVYEMTTNHYLVLPLMAAAFIATGVSRLICKQSLYRGLSDQFLSNRDLRPRD